jgi:hypothetical protein
LADGDADPTGAIVGETDEAGEPDPDAGDVGDGERVDGEPGEFDGDDTGGIVGIFGPNCIFN